MTNLVTSVSRGLTYVAMVIMFVMTWHIAGSVAMRWATNRDIPLTLEITSAYYMVALTFIPLAMIDIAQRHIRAEFLATLLPKAVQYVLGIAIRLAMFGYLAFLTWRTTLNAIDRTEAGDSMITIVGRLPTWPARWIVPFGLLVASCVALLLIVRAVQNRDHEAIEIGDQQDGDAGREAV